MAEEEVVEETPKPKKKNGKTKVEDAVPQATMAETQAVGPKTESMTTMAQVQNKRMKTMADKNRL